MLSGGGRHGLKPGGNANSHDQEIKPKSHKEKPTSSSATQYPYPPRKGSDSAPPFRVNSVLQSFKINPDNLTPAKTPMQLHRARVRITENEIGHSLNEVSKKYFGDNFPLPIKYKSSAPKTDIVVQENEEVEVRKDEGRRPKGGQKLKSFAIRQETYPAVVLLKTNPIAPLRLRSPLPQSKYNRRPIQHLEDLNVINGFTHINTDGRVERNTFAPVPTRSHRPEREARLGIGSRSFHAEIDMNGFHEDEIFFQTDDASLLVIGLRQKRDGLNARKVTELLEFPEGVYPESLCISRTPNGTLILKQHF